MNKIIFIFMALLLISCTSLNKMSVTPMGNNLSNSDPNIGKYYVKEVEIKIHQKIDALGKSDLEEFKNEFQSRLSSKNIYLKGQLPINLSLLIKSFKVKGNFARMNKTFGGFDHLDCEVTITNSKTNKVIKAFKAEIKSGIIHFKEMLFEIHADQILNEIFIPPSE